MSQIEQVDIAELERFSQPDTGREELRDRYNVKSTSFAGMNSVHSISDGELEDLAMPLGEKTVRHQAEDDQLEDLDSIQPY